MDTYWIVKNLNVIEMLIFIFFPISALILHYLCSETTLKKIITATSVLLLPTTIGYDFVLGWLLCVTIILASGLAWLFYRDKNNSLIHRLIFSFSLFVFLSLFVGFHIFIALLAGYPTTINQWEKDSYTIEYNSHKAFSGGAAHSYRAYHTPLFGLYRKKLQLDSVQGCILYFDEANIKFDECEKKIISVP